jgi:hypothetical protein
MPPQGERRRTPRWKALIPVFVYGHSVDQQPFHEEAYSANVSEMGALLIMTATVRPGQALLLTNKVTQQEQACRVAHVGGRVCAVNPGFLAHHRTPPLRSLPDIGGRTQSSPLRIARTRRGRGPFLPMNLHSHKFYIASAEQCYADSHRRGHPDLPCQHGKGYRPSAREVPLRTDRFAGPAPSETPSLPTSPTDVSRCL